MKAPKFRIEFFPRGNGPGIKRPPSLSRYLIIILGCTAGGLGNLLGFDESETDNKFYLWAAYAFFAFAAVVLVQCIIIRIRDVIRLLRASKN
jgi:hypothetical protein